MNRITASDQLHISASSHPNPVVRRAGFELDHPYLEQCWTAHLGPSTVALLRRITLLWRDAEPAIVRTDHLAQALGLGVPGGSHSRFNRTLARVVGFRLAEWTDPGGALSVYTRLPPLREHQLAKVPGWCLRQHDRLLADHLDRLAQTATAAPEPPAASSAVVDLTGRLDRPLLPSQDANRALGR